jgi:hypothetical protein
MTPVVVNPQRQNVKTTEQELNCFALQPENNAFFSPPGQWNGVCFTVYEGSV